jgi:hypothetical protein
MSDLEQMVKERLQFQNITSTLIGKFLVATIKRVVCA